MFGEIKYKPCAIVSHLTEHSAWNVNKMTLCLVVSIVSKTRQYTQVYAFIRTDYKTDLKY